MATFQGVDPKITSVNQASSLLGDLRSLYIQCKSVQSKMALYSVSTDATFNAVINALFVAADRTELSVMLTQINTLIADWELNHRSPLGLP